MSLSISTVGPDSKRSALPLRLSLTAHVSRKHVRVFIKVHKPAEKGSYVQSWTESPSSRHLFLLLLLM